VLAELAGDRFVASASSHESAATTMNHYAGLFPTASFPDSTPWPD
jgi:hypothetical protein